MEASVGKVWGGASLHEGGEACVGKVRGGVSVTKVGGLV